MAVTTTKTNKPLNPRGNDQSPKSFNRAALYSGKALDFDGANDDVSVGSITDTYKSFCFYFNADNEITSTSSMQRLLGIYESYYGISSGAATGSVTDETLTFMPSSGGRFGTRMNFEANTWYHVAVIAKESDNTYLMYINAQDKTDFSVNTHTPTAATDLKIAVANNGGTRFNGKIANFKAFDVALTAAQVADLYNNPEKVVPTGVADSALKLWLPMQEGAGTYCINGADPLGDDEYDGAGSFDSATGWTLNDGCSIGSSKLSIDGTQTANTSAYYNISSVASSLVFAEFTLSNVTAGQIQLAFFGASGTTTKWYTESGTYTELVAVGTGHNGNTGFIANSSFVGDVDNFTLKVVNTGDISGATWTHGIGAPVAQTAVIDWNKKRTSNTIDILLPQGLTTGRDITGVNLFENVRKQGALNLDGNSWAEVHKNDSIPEGDEGRTLECWFFGVDKGQTQSYMETGNNSANNKRFGILTISNDNIYIVGQGYDTDTGVAMDLDAWNHVAVTHDGSTLKVYKNGSLIKTVTGRTYSTANDDVVLGRNGSTGGEDSLGAIAQPRIYNRALSAEEVERNYNAGKNIYTNS